MINLVKKIPDNVSYVTSKLEEAGFEAYLVGGCVRDLLMDREPKDWDITTNATPEQIISLFKKTVYENTFGTVGVCIPIKNKDVPCETSEGDVSCLSAKTLVSAGGIDIEDVSCDLPAGRQEQPEYQIMEVTPYRIETKYSDFRHPDEIAFSENIEDDLKRRDFTCNAMAYSPSKGQLIDLYKGQEDIKDMVLRTVGEADDRFQEDALRMLRAVRFAVQLDFSMASETCESIFKNSLLIKNISAERIRDEFIKIILSKNPSAGILMLQKFNLLKNIIPELEEGMGCEQSGEHIYDVFDHLLHALQHAANKNNPLEIRLAALFHDIGKPKSRRLAGAERIKDGKKKYTFYGHEVVSARIAKKILERLKFSKKEIELVEKLVRNHMFFSDTELITLSAVRRVVNKVGKENIWALMDVRECDRVGMKKKEAPYRLRKYFAMIEEALRDPISVGQLKIGGEDLIKDIGIKPGPRMGWILNALLEEVLDDPTKNTKEYLLDLVRSLDSLTDDELRTLGERGKEKKEGLEEEEIEKLHTKHGVKK